MVAEAEAVALDAEIEGAAAEPAATPPEAEVPARKKTAALCRTVNIAQYAYRYLVWDTGVDVELFLVLHGLVLDTLAQTHP